MRNRLFLLSSTAIVSVAFSVSVPLPTFADCLSGYHCIDTSLAHTTVTNSRTQLKTGWTISSADAETAAVTFGSNVLFVNSGTVANTGNNGLAVLGTAGLDVFVVGQAVPSTLTAADLDAYLRTVSLSGTATVSGQASMGDGGDIVVLSHGSTVGEVDLGTGNDALYIFGQVTGLRAEDGDANGSGAVNKLVFLGTGSYDGDDFDQDALDSNGGFELFEKDGGGTTILSNGANGQNFYGDFSVLSGTLRLVTSGSTFTGHISNVTVENGGRFEAGDSTSVGYVTVNGGTFVASDIDGANLVTVNGGSFELGTGGTITELRLDGGAATIAGYVSSDTTVANGATLTALGNAVAANPDAAPAVRFSGTLANAGVFQPGGNADDPASLQAVKIAVGTYAQSATGRLDVQLGSNGASDRIHIGSHFMAAGSGVASLDGQVQFLPLTASQIAAGDAYVFIDAAGNGNSPAIQGTFANAPDGQDFWVGEWKYRVDYGVASSADPDDPGRQVKVTVVSKPGTVSPPGDPASPPPAASGLTPNQTASRGALVGAMSDPDLSADLNTVAGAVTSIVDDTARAGAYDSLAGELYAVSPALSFQADDLFRSLLSGRAASVRTGVVVAGAANLDGVQLAFDGEDAGSLVAQASATEAASRGGWVRAYGLFGDVDGNANSAGYDYRTGGIGIGADFAATDVLTLGASLGHSRTSMDFARNGDDADIASWHVGTYGSRDFGAAYVDAALTYNHHRIDATRTLTVGDGVTRTARGETTAREIKAYVEAGTSVALAGANVRPLASLEYSHVRQDGFTEEGAGDAGLAVSDETRQSLTASAGLAVDRAFTVGGAQVVPQGRLLLSQELLDDESGSTARFIGGGPAFRVEGADRGRTALTVGAGVTAKLEGGLDLFAGYDATLRADETAHVVTGGLKFRW